jgi:hypothetical protein
MRINPIAEEVLNVLDSVGDLTTNFVLYPDSAITAMAVAGDAGVGKSTRVRNALIATNHQSHTEYIKGGKLTAASLFVKLYLNRAPHRIIVIDDCDVLGHQERQQIVPMLLGATELGKDRSVSWETAKKNALMEEFKVPYNFKFEGRIIWITNDTKATMIKALKKWDQAILTRFNIAECNFNPEQKFMYTLHMIEHEHILGVNCIPFPGGYPQPVIDQTVEYLHDNWRKISSVTPRVAVKIADLHHHFANNSKSRDTLLKAL